MSFLAGLRPAGALLSLAIAALSAVPAAGQVDCGRLAQQIAAAANSGGSQQIATLPPATIRTITPMDSSLAR